jgi:hypothetical protein
MSQEAANTKTNPPARRERIRIRVESLRREPKLGMLGLPEIIALGLALVMLALVLFAYFYLFLPARSRQQRALEQRDALQKRLREVQGVYKPMMDTESTVAEIDKSLQDFEATRLARSDEGRMAIYQELNDLIKRNGLRASGGINYSPLDPLGTQASQQGTFGNVTRSTSSKWQSVYPGLGINLTVEGPYANVRRFVRDIEASRQFVVINAVELEGVTDVAARAPGTPDGTPATTTPSSIVSLRVDMAAYFRRAASNTSDEGQGQPQPTVSTP